MTTDQARNTHFNHPPCEHLTRFLNRLRDAELALHEYLAAQIDESIELEGLLTRPSGERFTAQLESRTVPDQPDQLWLVVSDISNLKRGEEIATRYEAVMAALDALETERRRYRDLFEFAPDSYFVTDETGIILDVNLAGAALVNTTKEQLVGTSVIQKEPRSLSR